MNNASTPELYQQTRRWFVIVFIISCIYAFIRYVLFKGMPYYNIPVYIMNKAFAITALFFIAASYAISPLARIAPKTFVPKKKYAKYWGLLGYFLTAIHIFLSLVIIQPGYFPSLFADNHFNFFGECMMLCGVLSFAIFSVVAISSIPSIEEAIGKERWSEIQQIGYWGLFLTGLHALFLGIGGWLQPQTWPGKLVPISLIGFIFAMFACLIKLASLFFYKPRENGNTDA